MPFDRIMSAVTTGEVDAGVIIHESRFTYPRYGCGRCRPGGMVESSTGHPSRWGDSGAEDLGAATARRSTEPSARVSKPHDGSSALGGLRAARAQEMDADVCRQHIDLYVNEFSLEYGPRERRPSGTCCGLRREDGRSPLADAGFSGRPPVAGGGALSDEGGIVQPRPGRRTRREEHGRRT